MSKGSLNALGTCRFNLLHSDDTLKECNPNRTAENFSRGVNEVHLHELLRCYKDDLLARVLGAQVNFKLCAYGVDRFLW